MKVKVKFIHNEWDNIQGGGGDVFKVEKLIEINDDVKIKDIYNKCVDVLNKRGYIDNWSYERFGQNGTKNILSVEILED